MRKSRISRCLVVALFFAVIVFLTAVNFTVINQGSAKNAVSYSFRFKMIYISILLVVVFLYGYIKDKLYKNKIGRTLSLVIRYVYVSILVVIAEIYTFKLEFNSLQNIKVIISLLLCIANSFVIKKIIFNISKSDILSVFTMFAFAMLMTPLTNECDILIITLLEFFVFFAILILQVLIDELKQRGLKTNKYIKLAILLGLVASVTLLFGINKWVYIISFIVLVFITDQLDYTHITFPRKFLFSMENEKRDKFYKIETININKLYVALLIALAIILIFSFSYKLIFNIDAVKNVDNYFFNYIKSCVKTNTDFNITHMLDNVKQILTSSNMYFMVLYMYIILIEVLSFFLRRKYDTKTTLVKTMYMLIIFFGVVSFVPVMFMQPIILTLTIIIAVINTTSIYLNREERIKLLKA